MREHAIFSFQTIQPVRSTDSGSSSLTNTKSSFSEHAYVMAKLTCADVQNSFKHQLLKGSFKNSFNDSHLNITEDKCICGFIFSPLMI